MSDSTAGLPAAEALRLAEHAREAAQRPGRMPGWYGGFFAFAFAAYGLGVGQAIESGQHWLLGVLGGAFGAVSGAAARIAMRSDGIVRRGVPSGIGGPVVLGVLGVCGAGVAGMAIAWLAGGGPRWIATTAGFAAGFAFWAATGRLNRVVRRRAEAR
ncbi:hypothetical protein [Kitasatospora brasiliensis]|uniref:hypothetical protein n=1 Tax=Kitasatospora brasiliensis TaxID=3058040 RepID=UPI002931C628|nr:hypothetical protein [Kitasatospora sp. K002]